MINKEEREQESINEFVKAAKLIYHTQYLPNLPITSIKPLYTEEQFVQLAFDCLSSNEKNSSYCEKNGHEDQTILLNGKSLRGCPRCGQLFNS